MHLDVSTIENTDFSERFAHFLARTSVGYVTDNVTTLLTDRGIENRLLDSLVAGLPQGAIIAGGFMTSVLLEEKTAKDIDLFFTSAAAFAETVNLLLNPPKQEEDGDLWAWQGYELKSGEDALKGVNSARYLTFVHSKGKRPDIQCLRMVWYTDAAHVIDSFDLTIAQFAIEAGGVVTYRPSAFLDLSRKRIVSHRIQFPASTLRRLIKYAHKGFYACPGSLAKICEEIQAFKGEIDVNAVVYVD
jgi:hypothetical protein